VACAFFADVAGENLSQGLLLLPEAEGWCQEKQKEKSL
jgi:hypothetical protein